MQKLNKCIVLRLATFKRISVDEGLGLSHEKVEVESEPLIRSGVEQDSGPVVEQLARIPVFFKPVYTDI